MIFYHPTRYGNHKVHFNRQSGDAYQTASVTAVKWADFVDVPGELILGDQKFTRRWDLPAEAFSHESKDYKNDQPEFRTVTDLYRFYFRRAVRSGNEKLKALSFEDWLELAGPRRSFDEVNAIDLLVDDAGRTWLVTVAKNKLDLTCFGEEPLIISNLKCYSVPALFQKRRAQLKESLVNLDIMEERVNDEARLIFFDDYAHDEPRIRMSSFLENLLK